jgi:hypothetical protein
LAKDNIKNCKVAEDQENKNESPVETEKLKAKKVLPQFAKENEVKTLS